MALSPGEMIRTLNNVNKVLNYPGWWEATRTTDPVPPNIIDLHRSLIVDIATAYLEENAVWGAPSPIDFVREYLSNEVNFDPLTASWLFLLDELARTELANGLAARISLMVSSWPRVALVRQPGPWLVSMTSN